MENLILTTKQLSKARPLLMLSLYNYYLRCRLHDTRDHTIFEDIIASRTSTVVDASDYRRPISSINHLFEMDVLPLYTQYCVPLLSHNELNSTPGLLQLPTSIRIIHFRHGIKLLRVII